MILPTCLRGYVVAVHRGILEIAYSLRRLFGQTVSFEEAEKLGVEPGSPVVTKRSMPRVAKDLIGGLVLFEGSLPGCQLNPLLHRLVHYPPKTSRWGSLLRMAMWTFERFNKRIKNLVTQRHHAESSIAVNIQQEAGCRFSSFEDEDPLKEDIRLKTCQVRGRCRGYLLSPDERIDLSVTYGIKSGRVCLQYKIANVLGVHFKAGEWSRADVVGRCGSVVTTIYAGRSRYCVVNRFIRVSGKDFACVKWLSKPHYPYAPNRLVVRVKELTHARQNQMPKVLPLTKIEPTPVLVDPNDGTNYYVMRVKGWDRVGAEI